MEDRVIVGIVGLTADKDEESVDMDELSKTEDTSIEEDADAEPDSEILSTDDDEVEEVEGEDDDVEEV